jgi:hypothetical protein
MMSEVTLSVPNAILFLFDLAARKEIAIPECVDGQTTSANASCVSVCTQADVDGDVTVRLANRLSASEKEGCQTVFTHSIRAPGHRVAVVTSEMQKILEVEVQGDQAQLTIAVDDPRWPTVVCIEAE